MRCLTCGEFFKPSPFNNGPECDDCTDVLSALQSDIELEVELLTNKSGRTRAVFYEDREEDSHGL